MLSFVLFVGFIIVKVNAEEPTTDNPEVRLFCNHGNGNKTFIVWKDKPLKIIMEKCYPQFVWCRSTYANYYKKDFIPTIDFHNDIIAQLTVQNVTAEMSTKWACTALQTYRPSEKPYIYKNENYIAIDLLFNVYVREARAVILMVNNRNLTYETTNLLVNYDGEAKYTYVDGEDLEISCKMAPDDLDIPSTLRLEYYNAAGFPLFQTKLREKIPHVFRSVLKSINDNYYLDCIRATENPRREYRYRTIFLKKKEDFPVDNIQQAIKLSVDMQELTTIFHKESSFDNFVFRYKHEGLLNVTCWKMDNKLQGTLAFRADKTYIRETSRTLRSQLGTVISLSVSTSNLTNKNLTCWINNTDVPTPNARILFLRDERFQNIMINLRGLNSKNILYQYTNDENQWTIEYQYSVNETLSLTCESYATMLRMQKEYPSFQWKFEGNTINSEADYLASNPSMKWSQNTFTVPLDATHNRTKLRCIYFPNQGLESYINSSIVLIFQLKPELVDEAVKGENTSIISAEDPQVQIIAIAVPVGVAIGVITIICLVLWRRRIKRTHLIQSEYDNFSNENESPIPAFPRQWESNSDDSHYAEVIEENDAYTIDTNKLHRTPSTRQSNISENHYTEIDDYFKPKPSGLTVNWNSEQPSNFNKEKDTQKRTPSHHSNHATQNSYCDSIQGTYDKLRHDNVPSKRNNDNYSNVQKTGRSKTVTFRQMSNDLRPERNYGDETSRQHSGNNERRLKQNSDGHYANVSQDINMQPGDLHKKSHYENHFLQNERSENNDYAEPYDLEVTCKNDLYG